ncbi:MAG: glycoside hydrolase family 3 protein [Spirochaeta sp.]|jgi:beta-N-acetylhexosaminidase|nr:glycoside hydrolase family 3 protein [Spirochaeta sp.]
MRIQKLLVSVPTITVLVLVLFSGCAGGPPADSDGATLPTPGQTGSEVIRQEEQDQEAEKPSAVEETDQTGNSMNSASSENDRIARVDPGALPPPRREVPEPAQLVDEIIAAMTVSELVGQLLMPAYLIDRNGEPVTTLVPELRALFEEIQPGGFLLFAANIDTPDQVRSLVSDLQATVSIPLLIGVDQEGGVVRRLVPSSRMPATEIPSASRVGRSADAQLAFQLAGVIARELRSLGINLNLAPVADVLTNPDNPVIGSRAYGTDPEIVATMVDATVRGLQTNGVSAALKHFPGHGDTLEDSHVGLATLPHAMDRLEAVELPPFVRGIAAGSDAVLTGHISVPPLTGDATPATLSRDITTGLLREHLGFEGVIITDALTMAALTNSYTTREIPLRAIAAGADILLRPADTRQAYREIIAALERGDLTIARIEESVRRILLLKVGRGLIVSPQAEIDPAEWVSGNVNGDDGTPVFLRPRRLVPAEPELGLAEHRAIVDEIMRRSER